MQIVNTIWDFLSNRFNQYLVLGLAVLAVFALIMPTEADQASQTGISVNYFYLPTCPHCAEQKPIIEDLKAEMPSVAFVLLDASTSEGMQEFYRMATVAGMDTTRLSVPTTFIGKRPLVGVHSKEDIRDAISECREKCTNETNSIQSVQAASTGFRNFELPLFGRVDLTSLSLPVLAVVLGLVDGFNPCAMWVLVYLIALLISLNDRKKMFFVAGTFVFVSGVLYFLFMTAWLNAFLLLGYIRAVTIAIGVVALGGGILSLKEYLETKGSLTCKVEDEEGKKKTLGRMDAIIASPLTLATIFGIIALAFVVNSVEFVCSAAIPAVFTQVLVLSNLSPLEHYSYIALYDIFFMLDDMIVFSLAVLAISSGIGEKYAKYCKALGGAILLILGILLLFAPHLLR